MNINKGKTIKQQRYFTLLEKFAVCKERDDFTECYSQNIIPINL